jgi:hypothetical protein
MNSLIEPCTGRGIQRRVGARRVTAVVLVCALAGTGCYRTIEMEATVPAPTTRIVANVSPVGAEEMAPLIGPDAVGIEAHVVRWDDTEAELALLRVDHRDARSIQWNQEIVVFPVTSLRNVRERVLDGPRTAGFVAGAAAVATVLALSFIRFVGSGDNGSNGGTDPVQ